MAKLITGYTGTNIFADDDQELYKGIVGKDNFVFDIDDNNKLSLTVISADNTVTATISPGVLSFNGRIVRVSTTESFVLPSVESGRYRKCIIVARYSVESVDQKESVVIIPVCSSESKTTLAEALELPIELNDSSIINGSTSADFKLYSFIYSSTGMVVDTKQTLFTLTPNVNQLNFQLSEEITRLQSSINDIQSQVDVIQEVYEETNSYLHSVTDIVVRDALTFDTVAKQSSRYGLTSSYSGSAQHHTYTIDGKLIVASIRIDFSSEPSGTYGNTLLTVVGGDYTSAGAAGYYRQIVPVNDAVNGLSTSEIAISATYDRQTDKSTLKIWCPVNTPGHEFYVGQIEYVTV